MKRSPKHTIDFLFPISLLFVFSATALIVLLFAANIYQNTVRDSENRFEQETSLSYVTNKIRQYDTEGLHHIYLDTFDGCDALTIKQDYEDTSYVTYIYKSGDSLKELFLQEGTTASAASGTTIMKVEDFQMEELHPGLFKFTCQSTDGSQDSVIVGVNSY